MEVKGVRYRRRKRRIHLLNDLKKQKTICLVHHDLKILLQTWGQMAHSKEGKKVCTQIFDNSDYFHVLHVPIISIFWLSVRGTT
jgi:hypothetical protein